MFSLITLGILLPYSISFLPDESSFSSNLDYFTTGAFSIDILITLNTGIYIRGELQMNRIAILINYIQF